MTESPVKVGAQLLESEFGASVPRVFSVNLIKTSLRRPDESGSLTNASSPVVTSAATRPSDVESFTKCKSQNVS